MYSYWSPLIELLITDHRSSISRRINGVAWIHRSFLASFHSQQVADLILVPSFLSVLSSSLVSMCFRSVCFCMFVSVCPPVGLVSSSCTSSCGYHFQATHRVFAPCVLICYASSFLNHTHTHTDTFSYINWISSVHRYIGTIISIRTFKHLYSYNSRMICIT